jgi:hypothetical protein
MQADKAIEEYAYCTTLPTAMRVNYACLARMNRWGHCPFMRGELRTMLGVTVNTLKKSLESLRRGRLIAPQSSAMCVVFNAEAVRRNDRATHLCTEETHAGLQQCMWMRSSGWETGPGEWDGMINDAAARELLIKRTRTRTETEEVRVSLS